MNGYRHESQKSLILKLRVKNFSFKEFKIIETTNNPYEKHSLSSKSRFKIENGGNE